LPVLFAHPVILGGLVLRLLC